MAVQHPPGGAGSEVDDDDARFVLGRAARAAVGDVGHLPRIIDRDVVEETALAVGRAVEPDALHYASGS
jgi:hypothetical protein